MNIVVTGGTKGIGRAINEAFAGIGFNIISCARNQAELGLLNKELSGQYPEAKIFTQVCDMGKKEEVLNFASTIKQQFSKIDVLVNNAGVFMPGTLESEADGTFETLMNLNIGGSYHITRALLPLIKMCQGHIFNICSTASITAYTNGGSYCISKFAMLGMSKVLREELKPQGVRVTSVLPGATLTHSWEGTTLPETRFMNPKDIAKAIVECYQLKTAVVEELLLRPQLGDI